MATRWLVGMMGAGKSTVGRIVADRLGVPFVDTDEEVTAMTGRTIEQWLAEDAPGFRSAEEAVVRRVAGSDAVVACGGGVVTSLATRELLGGAGAVIWLRADPAVLAARVGDGAGRPLLAGDPAAVLRTVLGEREAWYRAVADVVVDAEREVGVVVEEVVAAWRNSS